MTLNEFFEQNSRAALAFSGGVDSSYLLYAAMQAGADIKAYYVKAQFQPQFEFDDAMKLAEQLGADVRIIYADVLADPDVAANPADRCYYCKRNIFSQILQAAGEDGYRLILDGTNASDRADDRPGMKALREMEVRSPLRECGLTKAMIRDLSRQAGLFTWNKPAYACLATRIPEGTAITDELLQMTEQAEDYLFSLGFTDFRVRMVKNGFAGLQFPEDQIGRAFEMRQQITGKLKESFGYSKVLLDMETRNGQ